MSHAWTKGDQAGRPRCLDLFARAQGTSVGYARAGFQVTASDIDPYTKHPEVAEFFTADALEVLDDVAFCRTFQVIALSPPCQAHTLAQRIQGNYHRDFIVPCRERLSVIGVPYVIENVPGAPLDHPVEVCGCMFPELNVYRPRWFEEGNGLLLDQPAHRPHTERVTKMGRPPLVGERMHVVGNFSGAAQARLAMGIPWMTRDDLRESVPPAYTQLIGQQVIRQLA